MKTSKRAKKINIRLSREQYEHVPPENRSRYIRRLIEKDMIPSFLQFMASVDLGCKR